MQVLQSRSYLEPALDHIFARGEMADRTRAYDWASTPVGPIDQWPELLRSTVNTLLGSRQPMFLWWGSELTQFYNDAYRPSLGSDKHPKALGQPGRECWPEIWAVIGPLIQRVMEQGEPHWAEDQLIPIYRDGKLVDVYWTFSYSPVWDATGKVCGTLVACSETTNRVLAETAAKAERARLFDVLEQAPAFFALLQGPDHVFTLTNPLYMQLIGNRPVLGKPLGEALPEAVEQGYYDLIERVYRTGEPYYAHSARFTGYQQSAHQGDERYLDFTYQPLREDDGTISGVIVLGVDGTEKRRAENALIQAEKLAVVGRLAGSIAHEINNPLEAVTNLLYLARGVNDNAPLLRQYLELADQELRRMAVIASQTLRFYKQTTSPTEMSGEALATNVLTLFQGRISNSGVRVHRRHKDGATVRCFEGEIRQVLSNLVGNSLDAMRHVERRRLIIRTRNGRNHRTGDAGLVITVADTGPGMPPEVARQVFQPFFTTKGSLGTGLGMWISREIITRHAGAVALRSRQDPGRSGTVVRIFLPSNAVSRDAALRKAS
jgi:signal transduction histidine kinase